MKYLLSQINLIQFNNTLCEAKADSKTNKIVKTKQKIQSFPVKSFFGTSLQ